MALAYIIEWMKELITILLVLAGIQVYASTPADFAITDIKLGPEGFLEVHLANRLAKPQETTDTDKEKVFLTIAIEDIRRAEYKLKYMPRSLFEPLGRAIWTTNFRPARPVRVYAEVNLPPVILETRSEDNRMTRVLQPHAR